MQVHQTVGNRKANRRHLVMAQGSPVQMIEQRPQRVVVRDEPQLGARVTRGHVRTDVAEDVLVPQQDRTRIG